MAIDKINGIDFSSIAGINGVAKADIAKFNGVDVPAAGSPIITTNLVQHLDAGDSNSYSGSGSTWSDLTSSGVDGTFRGSPTYSSSDGGGSFSFDGVDDGIKFDYDDAAPIRIGEDSGELNAIGASGITRTYGDLAADGGITIQAWVKPTSGENFLIWSNNTSVTTSEATSNRYKYYQGIELWLVSDGRILLQVFDGNGGNSSRDRRDRRSDTGTAGAAGTWQLITGVLYGDTITQIESDSKIYVNGSEVSAYGASSGTGSGLGYRSKFSSTQAAKYHGGIALQRGVFRAGALSQVLVYNDILTSAEVLSNFNAMKSRYGL